VKIRIQSDYGAFFVSPSLKNGSIIGCGTVNFADMDHVYPGFTQQVCCRSWQPLVKQQFHG